MKLNSQQIKDCVEDEIRNQGHGSYIIKVVWKERDLYLRPTGHVFSAEYGGKNNNLLMFDTQTGKVGRIWNADNYPSRVNDNYYVKVLKIDQLDFNTDVIDALVAKKR